MFGSLGPIVISRFVLCEAYQSLVHAPFVYESKNPLVLNYNIDAVAILFCICENKCGICEDKGTDQLCSNCETDQRLCFRYTDSTINLLSKSKISSPWPSPMLVPVGFYRTCSKTTLLVFSCRGSNMDSG